MELNKLKFLGFLNWQTPNIIILEVCQSYRIKIDQQRLGNNLYRERAIKFINNFKYEKLPCDIMPSETEISEITKIATFINSSISWSYRTLSIAFNYWKNGTFDSKFFGTPTPLYPESNTLMKCYEICKDLNLRVDISAYELIYYAKILKNPNYLKNFVYLEANLISLFDNVKNYKIMKSGIYLTKEDWLLCKDMNKNILKQIIPQNRKLAVALSAIYYDIDISFTSDPISEFSILNFDPSKYVPIDPIVAFIYTRNSEAFKLSLNFNPNFSTEFYSPSILQKLFKFEGCQETSDPYYEILQLNSVIPTFYSGFRLGIQNEKTVVDLEMLDTYENSGIVSYGIREKLMGFTISEIIASFENNLAFVLPTNEILVSTNINKLFNIAKMTGQQKLIESIKNVRLYESGKTKIIAKLVREYNNTSSEKKEKIREMAKALLYLGFSMRGWIGGEFPTILCPVTEYEKVDKTIIDAILKFEDITNNEYGDLIRNFPLMKYIKNFIFSNNSVDGYTIIERINIVKKGDDENSSSCVRLSSNWLCASAYKMYQVLKLPAPFKIEDLRSIS